MAWIAGRDESVTGEENYLQNKETANLFRFS